MMACGLARVAVGSTWRRRAEQRVVDRVLGKYVFHRGGFEMVGETKLEGKQ